MKRKVFFAAVAGFVFCVLFVLAWKAVYVFVEDIPSLTFAAGGLCVIISGVITRYIMRDLMSVPQKD